MRAMIFVLSMLIVGCVTTAEAGTLNALATPDNAVAFPGYPSLHGCQADTWAPSDVAHGFCYRSRTQACSGRGCQPVVNSEYYDVSWSADGSVASSTLCGTRRHHNPQADVWVYQAGYNAASCHEPVLTSPQRTTIDGVNYYDFGVSPDGQYDLLRGNAGPFIYAF